MAASLPYIYGSEAVPRGNTKSDWTPSDAALTLTRQDLGTFRSLYHGRG